MSSIFARRPFFLQGFPFKLRRFSSHLSRVQSELTTRKLPLLYDYLSPRPSYLLNRTLQDFLPSPPEHFSVPTRLPSTLYRRPLPPSHHLVYFVTPSVASELLPDGTDLWHSPGDPWVRRMWAGGKIRFPAEGGPMLDGGRAVCVEGIRDVHIKGSAGEDKIFVGIERRVAHAEEDEDEHEIRERVWTQDESDQGEAVLIETRNLVFMRPRPQPFGGRPSHVGERPRKALEPPKGPAYAHALTPTPSLLFRYSALTFNAHSIHLDSRYATEVEHYPSTLVHGPLSLTILLTCLRYHLIPLKQRIRQIEYRNVSPLFCGETMRVCGKRSPRKLSDGNEEWTVWIENSHGALAVKGDVMTDHVGSEDDEWSLGADLVTEGVGVVMDYVKHH